MKKQNTFFLLLTLMAATSCKKTWQCECKEGGAVVDVVDIHDVGRMGAKNVCDSYEAQNNLKGAAESCKLK